MKSYLSDHKYFVAVFLLSALCACQIKMGADRQYGQGDDTKVYKLKLDPPAGSRYYYDITNQSSFKLEIDGKKLDNDNKTQTGVYYTMNKDSAGDLLLGIQYDKIHIYSKNGDTQSDSDASDGDSAAGPMDRLLGNLKHGKISAVIGANGEVKSVSGLREMEDRFMAQYNPANAYEKTTVKQKWDKLIDQELVNRNIDQLFRIFPDSGVRIGEQWKLSTKEKGEMVINNHTVFTLKTISGDIAYIESEGKMTSDSTADLMGYEVMTDLQGTQKGEYRLDTRTGMLLHANITATIEGTLQMMGRDIPVTIKNSVLMDRH